MQQHSSSEKNEVTVVPPTPMLTFTDVKTWLNVTERHLRAMVARGDIPTYGAGRLLRFDPTEVREALKRNGRSSPPPTPFDPRDGEAAPITTRQPDTRRHVADRATARALWSG